MPHEVVHHQSFIIVHHKVALYTIFTLLYIKSLTKAKGWLAVFGKPLVLYCTRIERSGNDELVVDSWCRVVGGSEMNHVIDSEGKVKGGYVDERN